MATSVVPALIDALVSAFDDAMPDTLVHDGFGITDDPGDYLMVGVEDPDVDGFSSSAIAEQVWANANYTARDESGEVRCLALAWNGDADQKAARDAAYAITAAAEAALRANPSLGLDNVLWTSFGMNSQLNQIQSNDGSVVFVMFSVYFRARI